MFGKNLKRQRQNAGLSQQALADQSGVHRTLICRYEAGKTKPTIETVYKLAVPLKCSVEKLLGSKPF